MKNLNVVALTGRIGYKKIVTKKEWAVLELNLAVNSDYKDKNGDWQENTMWVPIKYYGFDKATSLNKILSKGDLVSVTGSLGQSKWKDEEGPKSRFFIKAFTINKEQIGRNRESNDKENTKGEQDPLFARKKEPVPNNDKPF